MKNITFKRFTTAFIFSLASTVLMSCSNTATRTPPAATADPEFFHKSMRSMPTVNNKEAGGYAVSLTDELNTSLNNRTIVKSIVLERYKDDATIRLVMDDDACFGAKGTIPNKECLDQIQKMSKLLMAYHQTTVQIISHPDTGKSKNKKSVLAIQRAKAISHALSKQGLSGKRVAALGINPGKPVYSNETANGRKLNRQVELVINIVKESVAKMPATTGQCKPESSVTTTKPLAKSAAS